MSIQYTVLGFEPMTFGHESPLITTRPGLPPKISQSQTAAEQLFRLKVNKNIIKFFYLNSNQLLMLNITLQILFLPLFFKNGPTPASFSFIFCLFKQTSLQFYNKYM